MKNFIVVLITVLWAVNKIIAVIITVKYGWDWFIQDNFDQVSLTTYETVGIIMFSSIFTNDYKLDLDVEEQTKTQLFIRMFLKPWLQLGILFIVFLIYNYFRK